VSTYIILGKLTQKAIEQMKDFAERDAKGEDIVRALDGKVLTNYCTLGTRQVRLCDHRRSPIGGSNGKAPATSRKMGYDKHGNPDMNAS